MWTTGWLEPRWWLGIASFVSVPLVDNNRSIKSFAHLYPPKSPLADFMENEENKKYVKKLEKALRETQLWAVELWEAKQEDDDKLFEMLGLGDDEETIENFTKDEAPKPAKPIFTMSTDDVGKASWLKNGNISDNVWIMLDPPPTNRIIQKFLARATGGT